MHYKNGREAKNGDRVVVIPAQGPVVRGILYDATPGIDTCNGRLAFAGAHDPCPSLAECLHEDDLRALAATVPAPAPTAPA